MTTWNRGDLIELDGLLGVVVGVDGDPDVLADHVALWFGEPKCTRKSQGGLGGQRPEVWTVPEHFCALAAGPIYKH